MKITNTNIADLLILEPQIFYDERGYFFESYNQLSLLKNGINQNFVQDNESFSKYGVVRGLHGQSGEFAQAKLIRVCKGKILDIVVDIRQDSKTFGHWESFEISDENKRQLLIPRGCLHGFVTLSDYAYFMYKCDNIYSKNHEIGVNPLDDFLNIDWQLPKDKLIISEKDKKLGSFKDAINNRS
jgi:dTDP-4-dehydrorhamnose 3,5-epimerase